MTINLTKTEEQLTNEVMGKINLSKDKDRLGDKVINLSKTIIDLSKKAEVDLGNTKAQVVVAIDYSGSMRNMYSDGTVQNVIDKLVPLGLTFDDNGEVEVFRFETGYKQFESLTLSNYDGYVKKILDIGSMGGTEYAPVLKEIKRIYLDGEEKKGLFSFLKKKTPTIGNASENPVFIIFITDGDNSYGDKKETDAVIRELSKLNCFIQFVGVGNDNMSYLEKLDDLDGRDCDNTGFVRFKNINNVPDSDLYARVLEQFADWLKVRGF